MVFPDEESRSRADCVVCVPSTGPGSGDPSFSGSSFESLSFLVDLSLVGDGGAFALALPLLCVVNQGGGSYRTYCGLSPARSVAMCSVYCAR